MLTGSVHTIVHFYKLWGKLAEIIPYMNILRNKVIVANFQALGKKSIQRQVEINLSGYFLHSCFELARIEIIHGRIVDHS